ncbi:MAG: hypothetical protein AB2A00_02015 [Myxococcota bacterium]
MIDDALALARNEELRHRIARISSYPDTTFGTMTRAEMAWMSVVFIILPALLVWSFQ